MKAVVFSVIPDSEAAAAGICPGDIIEKVNGQKPSDELDFRFLALSDIVTLSVLKENGEREIITIEGPESPDLGIQFESALFGGAKHCTNKCIFCFIDQLPLGMRETLYFKDDDARLSFLTGNYITLTNLSDRDVQKIIRMRLSPINISVHTTDPNLRCKMLSNRHAGHALRHLRSFYDAGIGMNGQIVLVPGVNDGAALEKTISDLSHLAPSMGSVSVVPVGITRYRKARGLPPIESFTKETALAVLETVSKWQEKLLRAIGTRFIYAADEFYLLGEVPIPPAECYEGYAQIENGVGLLRSHEDEFLEALALTPTADARRISIATGRAAYAHLQNLARLAMKKCPQLCIAVYCIENQFFGEKITVAGLLTGQDLSSQLSGKDLGEALYIPSVMLRSGTEVFLDDMTVSELSAHLSVPIIPVKEDGFSLWEALRKEQ